MNRSAGVLLPVFSLPSKYGIGCFDQTAYDFVDYLADAGQTYWQILPLSITGDGKADNSPYQSYSAFAGNPFFISLDALVEEGVLTQKEIDEADFGNDPSIVNYKKLTEARYALLRKAYERSNISENPDYQNFAAENSWWLSDFALFMAVSNFFKTESWLDWPEDIRMHWGFAVDYYNKELFYDVEFQKYMQYKFIRQWEALKAYANSRNLLIIGDIPIYVSNNSADLWAHPELFQLDEHRIQTAIAGCPPDNFSADGQVWGTPLYNWEYHRNTGFDWWCSRLWYMFRMYDLVRIDHFRAFDEYFSIPYGSTSAAEGHWEPGPGVDLFRTLEWRMGRKGVIVEDLGFMTDTVRQLVRDTGFPNMKVFQFGFDTADVGFGNDYLIHNYPENCVAYTGTHDNETIMGWYQGLDEEMQTLVRNYICDFYTPEEDLNMSFVSAVMRSRANMCIIPLQDYIGMDNKGRVNDPSTNVDNWRWRLEDGKLFTRKLQTTILGTTRRFGRMNWDNKHLITDIKA